jgi:hypothetical protein
MARHHRQDARRVRSPDSLPQACRVFLATLELEHHSLDVFVILMPAKQLQALLRIAPFQNFDGLLSSAPRIHLTLVRHVEIDRIPSGKGPAVIFNPVILPSGNQAKHRPGGPARPISRCAADLRRPRDRDSALYVACLRHAFRRSRDCSLFFYREWLKWWRIRSALVHWNSPRNFICQCHAGSSFHAMNRRSCRAKFPAERVAIAILAMIRFRMRVRGRVHVLKIRLRQRRFVWRQRSLGGATAAKENDGDECREDG